MKSDFHLLEHIGKTLFKVLLPLALMPLQAEDQRISRERRFAASTSSGHVVDFWLRSRADLDLLSAATSVLDTGQSPLFVARRTTPDAAFLSAQAIALLDDRDRGELRALAERGVPIVCECGEYVLSRVIGFTPVEQDSPERLEFFIYGRTPAGALRHSVLLGSMASQIRGGILPMDPAPVQPLARLDVTDPRIRDQFRVFLLREALLQSLVARPDSANADSPVRNANLLSWTHLDGLDKTWTMTTPDVGAALEQVWNDTKEGNRFIVSVSFFKIPDGHPDTDYYLVQMDSKHIANSGVPYQQHHEWYDDGWVGWYVSERRVEVSRSKPDLRVACPPSYSYQEVSNDIIIGDKLDIGLGGAISAAFQCVMTGQVGVATRELTLGSGRNDYQWVETFRGARYGEKVPVIGWTFDPPSYASSGTYTTGRTAIYSTSDLQKGIDFWMQAQATFQKDRVNWEMLGRHIVPHPWVSEWWGWLNARRNFPPNRPARASLTIPGGSTELWTNVPIAVNVQATTDRDGDPITYSFNFGDGVTGQYGSPTQTHQFTRPGTFEVRVIAKDIHGAVSEWSEPARYTIKDRPPTPLLIATCRPGSGPTAVGIPFSTSCLAEGGAGPYKWSIREGRLPEGLALSATTGAAVSVSGTPSAAGNYSFLVGLTDASTPPESASWLFTGTLAVYFRTFNAAGFQEGTIAPDSIASLYGGGLAARTESCNGLFTTTLGGASVKVIDSTGVGRDAQLFFASDGQINLLVPKETAAGSALVRLFKTGASEWFSSGSVVVADIAPGIFVVSGGSKVPAAFYLRVTAAGERIQNYTFDPATRAAVEIPRDSGDALYLLLYGTGFRGCGGRVTATANGQPVPVLAALAQGEFAGLDQVNIGPLPRSLASGSVTVRLEFDGRQANDITIRLR